MSRAGSRDMTAGSVLGHLAAFSFPLLLGNLLQQFYSMVDSWVVGKYIGDTALTAVGAGSSVMSLFISLFSGMSIGATVIVSQYFGARQTERLQAVVDTVYQTLLLGAIPMAVIVFLGTGGFLRILHVDAVAVRDARMYIRTVAFGLPGAIGYNMTAGILRGLGNSRASLWFLVISSGINIVLDFLLVGVLRMGVAGAAAATVAAETVSWILAIHYLNRCYGALKIHLKGMSFEGKLLRAVMGVGLPAGLQQATISLGGMAVMSKVNTFGNSYSAGYSVGLKIDNMIFMPVQALSSAATAIVGQNVGAGSEERVRQTTKCVLMVCMLWCTVGILLIYPNRGFLVGLFTETPETIVCGARFVQCVLPAYFLQSVIFSLNSIMRGAGESFVPMAVAIIGHIFIRVPALYLLADLVGSEYMYYSFGIGWTVGASLAVSYFASGRWKRRYFPLGRKAEER